MKIIDNIRSLFCQHEFYFLNKVNVYNEFSKDRPCEIKYVYRCRKCGHVQVVKL